MNAFYDHDWPGNVRELEHAIEHSMIIIGDKQTIELNHIPVFILESKVDIKHHDETKIMLENISSELENRDLKTLLEDVEQLVIEQTLEKTRGNVAQAAKQLGINRQNLDYRIKKYSSNFNLP